VSRRIVALSKVIHTSRKYRRFPRPAAFGHLDEATILQCDRNSLVGEVAPAAVGVALMDPAQDFNLTVIQRSIKWHCAIRSCVDILRRHAEIEAGLLDRPTTRATRNRSSHILIPFRSEIVRESRKATWRSF
jgi:hypothetical protein